MNELRIFDNDEFGAIRTVQVDGEPWFVSKDIATTLGYRNARDAVRNHVHDDDKGVAIIDTLGGSQEMAIINESGMYALVFGSRLESAMKFKRWVTSKVLPEVRKTGSYNQLSAADALMDPDAVIKILQGYKAEKERSAALQAEVNEMQPKALFADSVCASPDLILVRDMAKILKQNGYDTGEKRLYKWLRDNGYCAKDNTPTQRAMDMNLFKIIETTINVPGQDIKIRKTTKVTGKGQQYFVNKLTGGTELQV